MDQARRDRYLAALGIVRYRPRPARGASVPPVADVRAPVPEMSAAPEEPAALLGQLEPSNPPHLAQPPAVPAPSAADVPAGGDAEELLPPLRLACWRPAEDLLVLDALPPGGRPSREQLALLGNILAAIGRRPAVLPAAESIDWPLLPGGDRSVSGAREALQLFLAGRLAQSRFQWLLAMGAPAWRLLADDADAGRVIAIAEGAVQAMLVPGLAEMLANPQCKAATWQAIRFLAPERQ